MTATRTFVSIMVAILINGCASEPASKGTGGSGGSSGSGGSGAGGSGAGGSGAGGSGAGGSGAGGSGSGAGGSGAGGSGAGGSGAGGSGAGGTGGPMGTVTIAGEDMLDDMDDGDAAVLAQGERIGYWYSYNDMTAGGMQTPADGADFTMEDCGFNGKGKCAHVKGMGFKTWGAGFGFDLNNSGMVGVKKGTYDLSAYKGIAFWAKSNVPFKISIALAGVIPVEEGGTCVMPAMPNVKEDCHDTHGKQILRPSAEWTQYVVPFSDLKQPGYGKAVAWDAKQVMSIQFDIGMNLTFDVHVDEVGLYK
jgi:hypothetical protein